MKKKNKKKKPAPHRAKKSPPKKGAKKTARGTSKKITKKPSAANIKLTKLQAQLEELISSGRPRGFVTDNEILSHFPNVEKDISSDLVTNRSTIVNSRYILYL